MKKAVNDLKFLFLRYIILFLIGILFTYMVIPSAILLIITIYPASFLINFFHSSLVAGSIITAGGFKISIIPACVAVSAYLLLIILNLATPMTREQRTKSLIFSWFTLLIFNVLRIFIFSLLFINNYIYFDILHKFFWYFLSIIVVVGIWFLSVYLFKIKEIPAYSDFKYLIKLIKIGK